MPKKAEKKKRSYAKITPAVAEKMFVYWCECKNIRETAKKFGVSPTTISRTRSKYKWNERFERVLGHIQNQSEIQAATGVALRLERAQQLFTRISRDLLDEGKLLEASVSDFIRIAKYIDELEGVGGDQAVDLTLEILREIQDLNPDDRKEFIAETLRDCGISDTKTVNRIASLYDSEISSSN